MMNQNPNPPYSSTSQRPTSLLLPPSTIPQTQPQNFFPQSFPTLLTPTSVISPTVMTPNTIKSILQTLGEDAEESYMMESQQYSGNFVPPLPSSTSTITLINTWQGGQVSSEVDNKEQEKEIQKPEPEPPAKKQKKQPPKKKQTKAAPQKKKQQQQASTPTQRKPHKHNEEDDRRKVRRERNKLAAARCRKRRVDHTNKLVEETEGLESKKRALQTQITELQSQKEELEFILDAHTCVKKMIKNEVLSDLQNLPQAPRNETKLKRPNTLNVLSNERLPVSVSTPAPPIPINTPSSGIAGLGFEPLCSDWGVNTPTPGAGETDDKGVSEKCGGSLVTPGNPFKKMHHDL